MRERGEIVINGKPLNEILSEHAKWIRTGGMEGQQADLREANLVEANLSYAYLREANLSKAKLGMPNLQHADFTKAILTEADLTGAQMLGANFAEADLRRAELIGARLSNARFYGTDFRGALHAYVPLENEVAEYKCVDCMSTGWTSRQRGCRECGSKRIRTTLYSNHFCSDCNKFSRTNEYWGCLKCKSTNIITCLMPFTDYFCPECNIVTATTPEIGCLKCRSENIVMYDKTTHQSKVPLFWRLKQGIAKTFKQIMGRAKDGYEVLNNFYISQVLFAIIYPPKLRAYRRALDEKIDSERTFTQQIDTSAESYRALHRIDGLEARKKRFVLIQILGIAVDIILLISLLIWLSQKISN